MAESQNMNFFYLILSDGTPKRAFLTALVVGSFLTAINHGDLMLEGALPPIWKILLTYCVPYCVTSWGSYLGKRQTILAQMQAETN